MLLKKKLQLFYFTSIFGVLFAVIGFSYNAWRLELTEDNNNIRTAAFEVLLQLSELEQVIYAAHYDQNTEEGSPRRGWVKVGLVTDLSTLISSDVEQESARLKSLWSAHWQQVASDEEVVGQLIQQIDQLRISIKTALTNLD